MAKRKVIWSLESSMDMIDIMNYYNHRNKSKIYSSKLYRDILHKLKTLDFSIVFPKKHLIINYIILLIITFL